MRKVCSVLNIGRHEMDHSTKSIKFFDTNWKLLFEVLKTNKSLSLSRDCKLRADTIHSRPDFFV